MVLLYLYLHYHLVMYILIYHNWLIEDDFIRENKIDLLVHGDDYASNVTACPIKIFPRTEGISSSLIRMINN